MNKRILENRSGATVIDVFIILGILVVSIMIALKADDVLQATYRKNCYTNQQSMEHVLHEMLKEKGYDLYQVMVAYTVFDPMAEEKYRMVVVLHPILLDPFSWMSWYKGTESEDNKTVNESALILDMTKHPYAGRILCPLRKGATPDRAAIDYWYVPMQRWYCLHNHYHN